MQPPPEPKLYHIVHVDRLPSIVKDTCLWCDAQVRQRQRPGTRIGYRRIKRRRLNESTLHSHRGLHVGDCVPFYFGQRPPMLHVIHRRAPELEYQGGQDPIIYLEADLQRTVEWADENERRWAFTTSNAGSTEFEDFASLDLLGKIDWAAVYRRNWRPEMHRGKQAEFLIEWSFPWELVLRICVRSPEIREQVSDILKAADHQPPVELAPGWYFE